MNIAASGKEIMTNNSSLIDIDFRKIKLQDLFVLGHQIDIASDNTYTNTDLNAGECMY